MHLRGIDRTIILESTPYLTNRGAAHVLTFLIAGNRSRDDRSLLAQFVRRLNVQIKRDRLSLGAILRDLKDGHDYSPHRAWA